MKPQKTLKITDLEPASTLLNELDDSELKEVVGGCDGSTNYPFGEPVITLPGNPLPPIRQCHNRLN